MQLTESKKEWDSLNRVLFITPDSLLVRLISLNSWELIFFRGLLPFIFLFIFLVFITKKNL
ncbi:MAG: hypothetical protein CM1200mP13_15620 [Candidatus Pelagibacterales bacterium]|nr:MAG: hypothetical protein CM1200mP13_15620 [Pelagibacterales bacterium]